MCSVHCSKPRLSINNAMVGAGVGVAIFICSQHTNGSVDILAVVVRRLFYGNILKILTDTCSARTNLTDFESVDILYYHLRVRDESGTSPVRDRYDYIYSHDKVMTSERPFTILTIPDTVNKSPNRNWNFC